MNTMIIIITVIIIILYYGLRPRLKLKSWRQHHKGNYTDRKTFVKKTHELNWIGKW